MEAMRILAYICFYIGDWCSYPACKFDNKFGLLFWELYQIFMGWSVKIQEKYKTNGPWKAP